MKELLKKQQKISFSGSGASHKNGSSELTIKTLVTMASTMLMHADMRFSENTFSTDIWPMAMDYAVWVYNRIPGIQSGLSAIEIWSSSRFETVSETRSNFHVWGCPTYLLRPKLQKPGEKIHKWYPRS